MSFLVNRLFLHVHVTCSCSQLEGNKVKGDSSWWLGREGSGVTWDDMSSKFG